MVRLKGRKFYQEILSLPKSSREPRKTYRPPGEFGTPRALPPSIVSQSPEMQLSNKYIPNIEIKPKVSKDMNSYAQSVPCTFHPTRKLSKIQSRMLEDKKIYNKKSDSSIDIGTNMSTHNNYKLRPKTASSSSRRKSSKYILENGSRGDGTGDTSEKKTPDSNLDTDNCFQVIKDAIADVIQTKLSQILGTRMQMMHQQIDELFTQLQKNEENMKNTFKELNAKIMHYGEDHSRHFRYLCMKLEYDKFMYQNMSHFIASDSTVGQNRPQNLTPNIPFLNTNNNPTINKINRNQSSGFYTQRAPSTTTKKDNCSCTCSLQDSDINNSNNNKPSFSTPQMTLKLNRKNPPNMNICTGVSIGVGGPINNSFNDDSSTCEKPTKLKQPDPIQPNSNFNNLSVLNILEEYKKRKQQKLPHEHKTATPPTDPEHYYNIPNADSEVSTDHGLKGILETIQNYYPNNSGNPKKDVSNFQRHSKNNDKQYEPNDCITNNAGGDQIRPNHVIFSD